MNTTQVKLSERILNLKLEIAEYRKQGLEQTPECQDRIALLAKLYEQMNAMYK